MADPQDSFEQAFNQIKQRMPSLNIVEEKSFSVLKIMLILFMIFFMIIFTFWLLDEEDNIVVQPFETVGMKENLDGKSLATLLSYNLQKVKNVYEPVPKIADKSESHSGNIVIPRPFEEFCITNSSIKRTTDTPMEYSLSQIGTVGFGGTSISIGNLLLSMKQFIGNKANVITCSLQRYNSTLLVVAILEDHRTSKSTTMTFEKEVKDANDEQIPALIDDLAYMIALELSKKGAQQEVDLYPQSWQAFKYLTEGREAYNNYANKKNINDLEKIDYLNRSRDMALLATRSEPGYKKSFELLSGVGFAYMEMGKYDEAAKIFENINDVKPFESSFGLGLVYGIQGQYSEALDAFNEAIRLNPQDTEAWNNKGIVLSKQGNYHEAAKSFENATKLNPQYATAWKYEGDALAHLGDKENDRSMYGEALKAYEKAIRLDPEYIDAWINKGNTLFVMGRYGEALKAYEKAIRLDPEYIDAWINKGITLFIMGRFDESIEAYNRAIKIDPNNKNASSYKALAIESLSTQK